VNKYIIFNFSKISADSEQIVGIGEKYGGQFEEFEATAAVEASVEQIASQLEQSDNERR
jgi:hypothetical protein